MESGIKRRLPRYKRAGAEKIGLRLQERDREILKLVYDYRLLTSRQIQCLVPGSDQVILRRLQKLFHGGYLDRIKTPVHDACVYGLGNRGADELVLHHGIDRGKIDWATKNREVKEQFMAHALMISNFRTILTLALQDRPETKILSWVPEGEFRDAASIQGKGQKKVRAPVIPDAFFTLADRDDELYFMLEADRSTMTNERFLAKLKAYWHWWQADGHKRHDIEDFRVLTVTRTEARKENLRKVAREVDDYEAGLKMFWFASEQDFSVDDPAGVLGAIWQTPAGDIFHNLLE